MKFFSVLLSMVLCLALASFTTNAVAQELGGAGVKENLDLPFDAIGEGTEDEDEDPPEVVNFYGQNLEGDGFFYVVDHSGSMNDSGELQKAKTEINKNINEISNKTEFAVVFFDMNVKKFPSSGRPVEANAGMKSAALSFMNAIGRGHGSCILKGLREGLQFANLAKAKRKVLLYVGDGGGTCSGAGGGETGYLKMMVAQITAQNYQRVQINCVGVMMSGRQSQENYLKQLCAANGGTYRRIN